MTQKPPFRTRNSYVVIVVSYELVLSATVSHRAAHTDNGATSARWPFEFQRLYRQYSCDLDDQLAKVPSL